MDRVASDYREFPAPAPLQRHLVCTWIQRIGDGAAPYRHRVLPDGCIDAIWIGDAAPAVAGPATGPVIVSLPAGAIVVGARFRPGSAPGFLRCPASALRDEELPLHEFWNADAERLCQQIATQRTAARKLAILEAALLDRAARAGPADPLAIAAVRWLARHPFGRVRTLAKALEVSDRQLQRRVAAAVGYGPKTLHRVLRLQRLLALGRAKRGSLAALAAEAGYADQAHMTREAGELTGIPPGQLLPGRGSTLSLSDLFKTAPPALD